MLLSGVQHSDSVIHMHTFLQGSNSLADGLNMKFERKKGVEGNSQVFDEKDGKDGIAIN